LRNTDCFELSPYSVMPTALADNRWWLDSAVGLAIAAVPLWQGIESWRGEDCGG
jgi:hypothetical protein